MIKIYDTVDGRYAEVHTYTQPSYASGSPTGYDTTWEVYTYKSRDATTFDSRMFSDESMVIVFLKGNGYTEIVE